MATETSIPEESFENYLTNARDAFVKEVVNSDWNINLRVSAEDFLICFDQLRERFTSLSQPSPVSSSVEDAAKEYSVKNDEQIFSFKQELKNAFKAGASWKASQPVSTPATALTDAEVFNAAKDYVEEYEKSQGGGYLDMINSFVAGHSLAVKQGSNA